MVDIRIDTSSLTYQRFLIPGVTTQPIDGSTAPVVSLEPGTYRFQQSSGILADFTFEVTAGGTVAYDERFDAFLSGRGSAALTVRGFAITLDTTHLSHDLLPIVLDAGPLPPAVHQLTLVPAMTHRFQPASGVVADFSFGLAVDGTPVVDQAFAGFARVSGRTVVVDGYQVTLDTRALSHDLLPMLLGWSGGTLAPGVHEFGLIPAAGYGFQILQSAPAFIRVSLTTDGGITLTDAPAGVTVMSSRTRCDVPDRTVTSLQIQVFGSSGGRWETGQLTVSIDPTNCNLPPGTATSVIFNAFTLWQAVVPAFFNFTRVPANGNIRAAFGGTELNPRFSASGGVQASALYPPAGLVNFDKNETWTSQMLLADALHEIGHAFGLSHSNNPNSIMFPFASGTTVIDNESRDVLRNLYGWRPQIPLTDRGPATARRWRSPPT